MKKCLAILVILVLAVPVFGKVDVAKKKQIKKTQHVKKSTAAHPAKNLVIRKADKNSNPGADIGKMEMQTTLQKPSQQIQLVPPAKKLNSGSSTNTIRKMPGN